MPSQFGVTPEVARIHWSDLLQEWTLTISWQLSTPFGTFRKSEHTLRFGDLASLLNTIKTIWAIVASDADETQVYVFAPMGDFSPLTTVPAGTVLRTEAEPALPVTASGDAIAPDDVPDYDGESDDWGATVS